MADVNKPTNPAITPANGASSSSGATSGKHWVDAEKLLARAQKEAGVLLERAQKEGSKLLDKAQKEASALLAKAKDNPKITAGIAAGAAATIAGGAYAATKLKSGSKSDKPKAAAAKPAARKPATRKPAAPKKS